MAEKRKGILRNLLFNEFSIVNGADVQPANPEATVSFYKKHPAEPAAIAKPSEAQPTTAAKEKSNMAETAEPQVAKKKSLADRLGSAVAKAFGEDQVKKAQQTRTYSSTSTETYDDGEAEGADEPITVVIQQTAPAEEDPLEKAFRPIAEALAKTNQRLDKLESSPVGSRVLKANATGTAAAAESRGGEKFPEFTKYLVEKSGLSAGQKLSKATITASNFSYGLSYAEADRFLDYIIDQSVLMKTCRTVKMPNQKYNIDKVGLGGKVLVKGTPGVDPGDSVSINTGQIQLSAREVLAIVSIGDDTLEDNIEGDAFVQHLLGMISRSTANELEQAFIQGDRNVADAGILDQFDGWYKTAKASGAHVVEAMADTDRYWPGLNATKMTRILKAIPSKYRMDMAMLGCILHNDLYLDYNDELASKGYSDAWAAITGMTDLPIRSVKNLRVPMLSTAQNFTYAATPYTNGTFVMVTDVRNLIVGIHRDIKMESFREPRKRSTSYVLSMRMDNTIENSDAIGIYDHAQVKN